MTTLRLTLLLGIFLALGVAGAYWAASRSGLTLDHLQSLTTFEPHLLVEIASASLLLYVVEAWRYRTCAAALGEPISWLTAAETAVACFFFSWITPGASLGAPAAIAVLGRRGVPWDAAVLIAFAKSFVGSAALLIVAFLLLMLGWGPAPNHALTLVLLWGLGVLAALMALPVWAATREARFLAGVERMEQRVARWRWSAGPRAQRAIAAVAHALRDTVQRLAALKRLEPRLLLHFALAQLSYFVVFIGIAVLLGIGLGASAIPRTVSVAIVFLAFTYVAPTPGASGLSELSAAAFFGAVLPPSTALLLVLLFRGITLYFHVLVGFATFSLQGGVGVFLRTLKRSSAPHSELAGDGDHQ